MKFPQLTSNAIIGFELKLGRKVRQFALRRQENVRLQVNNGTSYTNMLMCDCVECLDLIIGLRNKH